ncbi:MAG: zinc ribbon domain-containing protein [Promethearchaeota archaeon]
MKHFAVLSVIDTTDKENPIEIARYFIGSKQLFDMKFDSQIGKFVNRYNHEERKPSNVKLRLIYLRGNIKNIQRNKNEYENRCIERGQDFKKKLKFHEHRESLSILWERAHDINEEIVRQLNHHVIAIAYFHGASKIKMENLKFSKHSKKRERGNYLAFWQTHWLFGQIQEAVKLQACLHHVNFERVDAAYTSQRCSECGLIEYKDVNGDFIYFKDGLSQKEQKKQGFFRTHSRAWKQFTCHNVSLHKKQSIFRLDADLSAARNIALA